MLGQDLPTSESSGLASQLFAVCTVVLGLASFALVLALIEQLVLEMVRPKKTLREGVGWRGGRGAASFQFLWLLDSPPGWSGRGYGDAREMASWIASGGAPARWGSSAASSGCRRPLVPAPSARPSAAARRGSVAPGSCALPGRTLCIGIARCTELPAPRSLPPRPPLAQLESHVKRGSQVYEERHLVIAAWGTSAADLTQLHRMLGQICKAQRGTGGVVVCLIQASTPAYYAILVCY